MLQTIIAAIIVVLAAVWVLHNALTKLNASQTRNSGCGCGCSSCSAHAADQKDCGNLIQIQDRIEKK